MIWESITIDNLILVYVVGLFALIIISLYALIQSKANKLYTFILIPLALIITSMTWQGIKMLQGMPVYGLPIDEKIEVLYVQNDEPWIYVLLNSIETQRGPVFYKIDWTVENEKKMKKLQEAVGSSRAQGEFKKPTNYGEDSKSLYFLPMTDQSEHEGKNQDDERSVTFSTSTTTGSGPTTTIRRQMNFQPQRKQNMETEEDSNGISFTRTPENDTRGWSTLLTFPEKEVRKPITVLLNKGEY
jgi:hypothetical protein